MWFGTSEGLIHFDGTAFSTYTLPASPNGQVVEIWSLALDQHGMLWVGATNGVYQLVNDQLLAFPMPASRMDNARTMLSQQMIFKITQDHNGVMWFATDGHGLFSYANGAFTQWTTREGLPDNNTADLLEDRHGNLWIGTFYGGVSKLHGTTLTNYSQQGDLQGMETYNFMEDRKGNLWFTAEGFGVYRYDGTQFAQFTTEHGLTSNVVLSIMEDRKGQLWFGTWQGLCMLDGDRFVDAKNKESWTQ
jgi:ligand-binding sensor domain-containing protein